MHLRHLLVQNCKLMRELRVPFLRADGSPRMWTVFVGENGTCKTTLLRTIALCAAGAAFANNLAGDGSAYRDARDDADVDLAAVFGFAQRFHHVREYPDRESRPPSPPLVICSVGIPTDVDIIFSASKYDDESDEHVDDPVLASPSAADALRSYFNRRDPLEKVRARSLPHWFIAGYGVGRMLAKPLAAVEGDVASRDRMRSLFDARHLPRGTGFSDAFALEAGEDRARAFARTLREALVERMRTPRLKNIELRGKGGANNQINLIESHRFGMQVGDDELKLPAIWLSQGYQAVISLVADIIGNVWLEAGAEVALDDMEGIVLVDEIDLHLHPTWQTEIVAGLKRTFPNMQFIVTTHSPLVLAGCKTDEVFILQQDEHTGDVTAVQSEAAPMVMTGSELNREYFGVKQASPWSEHLRRYVELASNPFRSDLEDAHARQLLGELRANDIPVDYEPVARKSAS